MEWPTALISFALGAVVSALAFGTRIGILDTKMAAVQQDVGDLTSRMKKAELDINGVAKIARRQLAESARLDNPSDTVENNRA